MTGPFIDDAISRWRVLAEENLVLMRELDASMAARTLLLQNRADLLRAVARAGREFCDNIALTGIS